MFDFGAQYGQLIARRVRDLHVYSEIVPCDITAEEVREMSPSAIILSGGPASVNAEDAPRVDPAIYELGVPVLGFCYGHQITAVTLGGTVFHPDVGEYGPATLHVEGGALFEGTPTDQTVWMSHFDAVRDVLRLKIGVDGRYNTKYYAFGYNPATGQFYNQRAQQIGGYPMLDVYIAAKWKRMRILLKVAHLSEDFFNTREYFQVLHYPLNKRVFKIGISWGFYD